MGGDALAALDEMKGKDAEGQWKITVQDSASQDTGSLTYIELKLKGYFQ